MSQQHLVEVIPFEYTIVESAKKRDGVLLTLEGTFQRADTRNANGRIYPLPLWKKIIGDEGVNERLKTRRMLGELDHPASGATSLSRVSHVVTEHKLLDNKTIKGRLDILDTPMGQIAATLAKAGVQIGVSSRGDGSVERKGDVDEVQNDYRLETYDIVLKPSTPGAYPQIIENEEKAKENLNLIAQAVEGLVKSTDEVDVLLECHKIISVLEGCESRCESILGELKTKLSKGQKEQKEVPTKSEETMSGTAVPAPTDAPVINMSPEMREYLQEWVDKGVAEAVAGKDEEISQLNERIVNLTATNEDLEQKVSAAEELIEEFVRKMKDLSENAQTDEELQERYDASVALLDEAVSRLQEFGETQRRLAAAEELLAATIVRQQHEAVSSYIESSIDELDEDTQDMVRGLLEDCSSPEEVNKRLEHLSGLIENVTTANLQAPIHEPLPPRKGSIQEEVREDQKVQQPGSVGYVTKRILSKIEG